MATFSYTSPKGSSTIDAPDRPAAVRELLRRGITPTQVTPVGGSASPGATGGSAGTVGTVGGGLSLGSGAMSRGEMARFIGDLAVALSAGLPLVMALRTLSRQARPGAQARMLEQVIDRVEHGRSLADAQQEWGKPFSDLTINLTRAGEVSGRLPEVLVQAADLLDRDLKLRRAVLSAVLYPSVLLVLVIGAIAVVVGFIVPTMLERLEGQALTLPLPTRILQGVAGAVTASWWWVTPIVLVGAWSFIRWYRTPEGRLSVDARLLRVPAVGRLLRDVAVARFAQTLGTLVAAGIPVLSALRVTRGTLGNRALEVTIDRVADDVAAGRTIADALEAAKLFPPMLVQVVNIGERSGRLDHMLLQASRAFEAKTETSLKVVTALLPPILVAFMACVVGFVVLALLLALLSLQDAVMAA